MADISTSKRPDNRTIEERAALAAREIFFLAGSGGLDVNTAVVKMTEIIVRHVKDR